MTVTNPYAHIATQMRALLNTEQRMPPQERASFSWMIRADFLDTHCTVIKGGANTCILQLGEHRMDPAYPVDVLRRIHALRAQPYHAYVMRRGDKTRHAHALDELLAIIPHEGDRIAGRGVDGVTVTHAGRVDAVGRVRWIARGRGNAT